MTEHRIFEILLENHKNEDYDFDYPKLQEEAVRIAAKKFTDIIYDTLKQKSSASSIKRGNVLKFINSLCEVKESHLNEDTYKWFMNIVKNSFEHTEDEDVGKLAGEINSELGYYTSDKITDHVLAFYERKHSKQKENVKRLETIKKMDQEKLVSKFNIQVRRNFSYYETNENLIRDLLQKGCNRQPESKGSISQMETRDFREKQIKLAYAIINLKNKSDMSLIKKIVLRISKYKKLQEFEVNFLRYIFLLEDDGVCSANLIVENFPFVLERIILKYATDIISLTDESDLSQFFVNLEDDKKIAKIRTVCKYDILTYYKLKSLIYELYCYSYCNINVLKLIDFVI